MSKHTALYYESEKNLLEFIVPYFEQGFRENELCMWVVPQSLGVEGAKAVLGERIKDLNKYLEKGQIEVLSHKDAYLKAGEFSPDNILRMVDKKMEYALKQGFSGLRSSGDVSWLQEKDWDKWVAYEEVLDKLISKKNIIGLCTFPVEKFDVSKLLNLSASHGVTIRKKDGNTDIFDGQKEGIRDMCKCDPAPAPKNKITPVPLGGK
jgi:hypothetical protein